ncbi:MAG: hypothetical protein QM733_23440 [Ilumatobacteraceae bacterium]
MLVDSPRFTEALAGPIGEMGGVDHVVLTHRDDVADAQRWATRFGARHVPQSMQRVSTSQSPAALPG